MQVKLQGSLESHCRWILFCKKLKLIKIWQQKEHRVVPWKKLRNDREVWRTSNSTHEKNNIWMPQSTHYSYLILHMKKMHVNGFGLIRKYMPWTQTMDIIFSFLCIKWVIWCHVLNVQFSEGKKKKKKRRWTCPTIPVMTFHSITRESNILWKGLCWVL